jgi:uncharacterized SAM-binding protein YcdF (DUF218 family)
MISIARVRQFLDAPMHGAIIGIVILATAWVLGLPAALGFERPLSIPVAIVLGALLGYWFLQPLRIAALVLAVLAAVGIWSPLVPRVARTFVRSDAVNLEQVDAIFVFSSGVNSHGLVNREGLDRLLAGITLRAKRPALPLVVSIVRATDRPNGISSLADQRALIGMVPATGAVEWIDSVHSTRDEAVRLARMAFTKRWKRVAVITSPMHTRRACATVEGMGLPVTCVVAPWRPAGWPPRTASDRLIVMQRLTYESLAWAQYRVSGWADW